MSVTTRTIALTSSVLGTGAAIFAGAIWLGRKLALDAYQRGLLAGKAEAGAKTRELEKQIRELEEEVESGEEEESDEEDAELVPQDLGQSAYADTREECKLVLVVRTDLKMGPGKIAAQCSHATLACYKTFLRNAPESPVLRRWERAGQMKVALKVQSEDEMLMLQAQALSLGICAQVIHDAGRTQIAAGSATVLGVGPAPLSLVNKVTGHLKLL